jgi:hypothetical protein
MSLPGGDRGVICLGLEEELAAEWSIFDHV